MIDPVTLAVINNNLVNICREMGIPMMNTAFSPIFNEGLDFSCALFDRRGDMIGQAEFCPSQIGAEPVHRALDARGARRRVVPARATSCSTTTPTAAAPPPRALLIEARLPRGRAVRLRRHVGHLAEIGGMALGQLRRRRHRDLPGGPAPPARQDRQGRRQRHGPLAADHGQPPHAAEHLGRPPRADRLAAGRRAARARAARPLRPRVRRAGLATS